MPKTKEIDVINLNGKEYQIIKPNWYDYMNLLDIVQSSEEIPEDQRDPEYAKIAMKLFCKSALLNWTKPKITENMLEDPEIAPLLFSITFMKHVQCFAKLDQIKKKSIQGLE